MRHLNIKVYNWYGMESLGKDRRCTAKSLSPLYLAKPFQNFDTLNLIEYNLVEALGR
jgi:hypothetical protein